MPGIPSRTTEASCASDRSACQPNEPISGGKRLNACASVASPEPSTPWHCAHRCAKIPSPSATDASLARKDVKYETTFQRSSGLS